MRTLFVVFRKELTDLFRDARSVSVSLLVPVVLFPLVFGVMATNLRNQRDPAEAPIVVATGVLDPALAGALAEIPLLAVETVADPEGAVTAGDAEVALTGGSYDPLRPELTLLYLPENPRSLLGADLVEDVVIRVTVSLRRSLLESVPIDGVDGSLAEPVDLDRRALGNPAERAGSDFLGFLVPLLLIVATCISPLPSAADLGAGEKERGTLSTLLVSPTGGASLILGKLGAVSVMGILGTLSFGVGVAISLSISPDLLGVDDMVFAIPPGRILLLAAFGVALALCFSAVELLLSLLAKSPKEAQVFYVPLLILSTAAGYGTYLMDLSRLSPWLPHLPVLNVGLAVKQIVFGDGAPHLPLIAGAWMAVYLALAVVASVRLVRNEKVALRI
ncbi:MAG: ABC transporter permease [Spirochaetaceae bacterium]